MRRWSKSLNLRISVGNRQQAAGHLAADRKFRMFLVGAIHFDSRLISDRHLGRLVRVAQFSRLHTLESVLLVDKIELVKKLFDGWQASTSLACD